MGYDGRMETAVLADRVRRGDTLALSRAITLVENRRPGYRELLRLLAVGESRGLRIGITGAPGSGKSTLVDQLIKHIRGRGLSVGVAAIDPSSPISGGAILGDRIRMVRHALDEGVFIRSLASRGALGGLSRAAADVVELLGAAGKDVILIETVGVGQSEIDVVSLADLVLLVLTPASGDEIQVFKAGVIEVADLFVINKADLGGAEARVNDIRNFFSLAGREPLVFKLTARADQGVAELLEQVLELSDSEKERIRGKREKMRGRLVLRLIEERLHSELLHHRPYREVMENSSTVNPYDAADLIYESFFSGGKA